MSYETDAIVLELTCHTLHLRYASALISNRTMTPKCSFPFYCCSVFSILVMIIILICTLRYMLTMTRSVRLNTAKTKDNEDIRLDH